MAGWRSHGASLGDLQGDPEGDAEERPSGGSTSGGWFANSDAGPATGAAPSASEAPPGGSAGEASDHRPRDNHLDNRTSSGGPASPWNASTRFQGECDGECNRDADDLMGFGSPRKYRVSIASDACSELSDSWVRPAAPLPFDKAFRPLRDDVRGGMGDGMDDGVDDGVAGGMAGGMADGGAGEDEHRTGGDRRGFGGRGSTTAPTTAPGSRASFAESGPLVTVPRSSVGDGAAGAAGSAQPRESTGGSSRSSLPRESFGDETRRGGLEFSF